MNYYIVTAIYLIGFTFSFYYFGKMGIVVKTKFDKEKYYVVDTAVFLCSLAFPIIWAFIFAKKGRP